MSLVDTDLIWRALGSFYDLFPDEERTYWSTFWEAWSDVVADLWGLSFQADLGKSLYSTTATFERREALIKLTALQQDRFSQFRISSLKQDSGGRWLLRGFVPRDLRSFKAEDIPDQGTIRIGTDVLDYIQVTITSIESGIFAGFVREATFVLSEAPPHAYGDDPDFNDDFNPDRAELKVRVAGGIGDPFVDAVLVNPSQPVTVNDTGRIIVGSQGVNQEVFEYTSVVIIGDRYFFQLAQSFQDPATSPQTLTFEHTVDEQVIVDRYDDNRWDSQVAGWGRVTSPGSAVMTIDNLDLLATPQPPSEATLIGVYELKDNVDFDVSVKIEIRNWEDVPGDPSLDERRAVARLAVGGKRLVIGVITDRTGGGAVTESLVYGVEGSETKDTPFIFSTPLRFEARFKRVANRIELLFRNVDTEPDFTLLTTEDVSGNRAHMDLVLFDSGTSSASIVSFDEVIRRDGGVVGSDRLEEFFDATSQYPFTYTIDQPLTSAVSGLRDRPRPRTESMTLETAITDRSQAVIRAVAADVDEFEVNGIQPAGVITVNGRRMIYDSFVVINGVHEFALRTKVDPDLVTTDVGTDVSVETRQISPPSDFTLPGDSTVSLRELATRDRMWAPLAQEDKRHVQDHYGVLTDLDAAISTETYLRRVQGVWQALMLGPSIRNVETGLALTMGLPVSQIDGVVDSIDEERDELGQLLSRSLTVLGTGGAVVHNLRPDLPFIDWSVDIGQRVDAFEPLTNGVEVLDVVEDPLWYQRFTGVSEFERWNSFGVFVALESLNADASVEDAIRFALRIKPIYTKLFIRFLLTSGNEDLSGDLDDDTFAIIAPEVCEDMSFDEGAVPADPDEILKLGEGHKLGQGKSLGGSGLWNFKTLDQFTVKAVGSASIAAGSDIVTTDVPHGAAVSDVLVISGATALDDNGNFKILAVNSPTEIQVLHVFGIDEAVGFETRDYLSLGEGATLGEVSAFRCFQGHDQNLPTEVLDAMQVVNMAMSP